LTSLDDTQTSLAVAMFEADAASRALGIEVIEIGTGSATATMPITATMTNGHGITHGGYIFLLADTTFALACNSHGRAAVAARADIRYLRQVRGGDTLTATAVERARFGRNGIYDVTVTSSDGTVVAEFRGDSRVIASPASSR
jgi:acyl-CoA thioesterase